MSEVTEIDLEIEQTVIAYRAGGKDEKYLKSLMDDVEKLIILIAKPYLESIHGIELEDLVQDGYIVLMRVIEDYSLSKGCRFSTVLKTYLQQKYNRIYNHSKRKCRDNGSQPDSLERLQESNKDGEIEDNYFSVDCSDYKSVEFKELLEKIDFTEKEKVVVNVLMEGGSNGDCAKALDITPSSITYYFKKIGKKLLVAGYAI